MTTTETQRIAAVNAFKQLDLNANKELNNLVSQISTICNTSMASLTLLDEHLQWIKCGSGLLASQERVEDSFCKYLLHTNNILVIPNALLDERFANIPLVTGLKHIRFYAGSPLITTSGYHLGALCVYDEHPHDLTREQRLMLTFISKQVMHMMEMLLSLSTFKLHYEHKNTVIAKAVHTDLHLQAVLNNLTDIHLVVNQKLNIINFNKAASAYIKNIFAKKLRVGKSILNFMSASMKGNFIRSVTKAFKGKKSNKDVFVSEKGKAPQWWKLNFLPVRNAEGTTVSVAYSAANITSQKLQVAETIQQNESLLKIANLQSHVYRKPVASILGLMNIIKGNNYKTNKKCLMLMESAVLDLDEKIKNVALITEANIIIKN